MTCVSSSVRSHASDLAHAFLTSLPSTPSHPLRNLRIGIPTQTRLPAPHLAVPAPLLDALQALGGTIHAVELPSFRIALPAYYVLASAEASSNLARYGGGWFGSSQERGAAGVGPGAAEGREEESGEERRRRIRSEGFGREVKKRILAGTYALSAE